MPTRESDQIARLVAEGYRAHQAGRTDIALQHYGEALKKQPKNFEAAYLSGVIYLQGGKLESACRLLAAAIAANPNSIDAASDYGTALAMSGELAQAISVFDQALSNNPRHPGIQMNRANVLVRLNRIDEAISALTAAHAIDPTNPQIPNNKANALSLLGRFDEALQNYTSALKIAPNYVEAIVNRGNTLLLLNRNQDAMASYQEAIRLRPDDADAHYGLSFTLLRLGDLKRGFREYEWRWRRLEMSTYRRDLGLPLWMGDTSIEGKTLLLHAEQGFGDTIHFVRYASQLAKSGGKILLEVQPSLKPLIHEWPGISVFGRGEALPSFDLHCPLLSLPFVLGTSLETISADVPYLTAPAERVEYWRGRIPRDERLKVGITWLGSKTFRNDRHRSMTLESFGPILNTPDVTFVTLNPDLAADDLKLLADLPHVVPLANEFRSFADTAGVIENLDLVISTDTSVPHLAGAMKKEVWILLGYAPDWRWLLDRNDSPWYPTAKLYRQSKIGDWSSLVEKVSADLAQRAGGES